MKYFFILGNNPSLSVAEIVAVLGTVEYKIVSNDILLADLDKELDVNALIKRLGGCIKIGVVSDEVSFNGVFDAVKGLLDNHQYVEGKFKFGISSYDNKVKTKPLAMEMKKHLKSKEISCRWVSSKEKTLSSVVVEQNKLMSKGIEIVIFKVNNKMFVGKTLVVQLFKELSFRDFGRPARDDRSGMLPPKLAQIMINLSQTKLNEIILDPFCGSGTVVTESMLMGFEKITGSDISGKAVSDTKENIKWIEDKFNVKSDCKIIKLNAEELSKEILEKSINGIVTEPYLGPQRGELNIKKITQQLEELYNNSLKEFHKVLKDNGKIVMIWPTWNKGAAQLNLNLNGFKIVSPLSNVKHNLLLTERDTIIYGREDQKVWREIVILEKK